MKIKILFIVLVLFVGNLASYGQIAADGLNSSTTLFTLAGGAYYNTSSAAGDRPASIPFFSEGTASRGVINGTATLTSSDINTSAYTGISATFKLASFSIGSTGNGADGTDIVTVEISPNGGTNYYSTVRVLGNSNAYWAYSATGAATTAYDGNATPVDFTPAGGGSRTTDGYSTVTVTGLPATTNLRVRITMLNNATAEQWVMDDFKVQGTPASPVVTLADNGTQITAGNVAQGATNQILSSFQLTVANTTTNLTQASFLALGNYQAADITASGFTLWYSTTNTFGTAAVLGTPLSSTSTGSGDVLTFTGFTQTLAVGPAYFWVTANISSTATTTHTINIDTIANADLIFSAGTKSGSASAAGVQTIIPLTKTTIANGDWANGAIWSPAGVPTSSQNVVVNHIVTSLAPITRDLGTTSTISAAASLAVSATYTNNGTTTVNGTFQLNSSGWATGSTNFVYGGNGTLVFNTTYTANSGTYWPAASGPFNVTVTSAGALTIGFTRTVGGLFQLANNVDFTGFSLTLNGTCQINSGGFFTTSPIYGSTSLLKYNTTGTFRRGFEWLFNGVGTIGSSAGYPNNVQVSNNTTLDYNNGNPANKAMNGSLTIDSGSTFTMADTTMGAPSAGTLTIAGSVTNNGTFTFSGVATPVVVTGNVTNTGTLTLGSASGSDLKVGGNLSNTNTFNGNGRAVFFTKAITPQIVTSSSTLTIPYVVTTVAGTTVQLAAGTNLIVSAPAAGNAISFSSGSDVIDINGNSLTIGTTAVANVISGSGSFKGSTASNLTLLGTGSVGTLNFSTDLNLSTFTINRTAAAVACVMGSAVTVNTSLVLTNGLVDLAANSMTLAAACSNTFTASSNSYVIADVTSGGVLSKGITATGTVYNFPIGDRVASTDGSQYSPATINFAAGTFTAAFLGVAVQDSKHPNMDATTNFITRYWAVTTTGTFTSPTYTFGSTYLSSPVGTDITGTENLSKANQWNGTVWSNTGGAIGSNTLSIAGCTNLTSPNHFSAGQRDREINIVQTATNYLTGSTYNFGNATSGFPIDVVFTIQNLGQQTLTLGVGGNAPAIAGGPSYSLQTPYNYATPTILGMTSSTPNTQTFTIRFNPTGTGTFTGSVTIKSDDADEGAGYVINFTGVGVAPTPEINIRAASGGFNSITSGNITTTNGLQNTAFGSVNLGSNVAKDFEIQNTTVATAVLTLTGTPLVSIGGANPGDFVVTTVPPSSSIAINSSTTFIITFTPQAVGIRSAIVSIANNDSDENPYTYLIDGTGVCLATANTVTPSSGSVGTQVTVTATSNNLTGATLTLNGVSQTVTPVSSTVIKFTVPSGATSGNLITTNSQGCTASNSFTVISSFNTACEGGTTAFTDIIISEVYDALAGSSGVVELYNPTTSAIDLTINDYRLARFTDAGAPITVLDLMGTIPARSTYLIAADGTATPCTGLPLSGEQIGTGYNANDRIELRKFGTTPIDVVIGPNEIGYTIKRLTTASGPTTTFNAADWTFDSNESCTDLGLFNLNGPVPLVTVHPAYTPTCKSTSLTVAGSEGFAGGLPLAYQWYFVPPNTANWTAVTDGGLYSGATTVTLNITDVSTLIGYQFYCQVRENGASCYSASNAVLITTAQTTTWQAGNTWSNLTPDINKVVIIDNDYDTTTYPSFDACNLTINNAKTVTIRASNYVNIQNNLTVNAGGSLIVENNGSLVMIDDSGVVTNNGTTQIKRTASGIRGFDYVYWSSPVIGQSIDLMYSSPTPGYKYKWNALATNINSPTSSGTWQLMSGTMAPGTGYIVRGSSSYGMAATSIPSIFSGAVNNGVISPSISRGSYQGANYTGASNATVSKFDDNWNLVGNPYPSSIKALDFLTLNNNIQGFVYLWTHGTAPVSTTNPFYNSFVANYTSNDYITYNGTATTNGPTGFNGYIAAGQGFFVLMNDGATGTQTVNFKNSLRSKTYANSQFYRTAQTDEKHRIWLDLVDSNNESVRTVVGYVPEATNGLDRLYDAYKNVANEKNIYSLAEDETLIIQGRSLPFVDSDQVPLGVRIMQDGAYKIAIAYVDGLFEQGQPIYLEDKLLGIIYDLRQNPYSFNATAGIINDRFVLRYTNTALGTPDFANLDRSVVVATNHGEMTIKSYLETIQEVTVYDILGRQLLERKNIDNNTFITSNISVSQQALIVKIKLANGLLVTRKIVL